MVAEIIEQKKDEIAALCRKHQVRALWVFGSAATGVFDPGTSDLDFLVDLGEYDKFVHRRFFGLLHDMEELIGSSVDLLTVRSIDNPYFMEELKETCKLIYGTRRVIAREIEQNMFEILALCCAYRVRALWVFGSATTGSFDPDTSDLDFLVDLGDYSSDYASRFFGLRRDLETITARPVDLLSVGGFSSERDGFQDQVESTRLKLFDAEVSCDKALA